MTSPDETSEVQQRSSVKITLNAKRDPQWEIKVVVGDTENQVEGARQIAVRMHQANARDLGVAI